MQWALVDANNIVQDLIVYDGHAVYTPEAGLELMQVNDWIGMGDAADKQP